MGDTLSLHFGGEFHLYCIRGRDRKRSGGGRMEPWRCTSSRSEKAAQGSARVVLVVVGVDLRIAQRSPPPPPPPTTTTAGSRFPRRSRVWKAFFMVVGKIFSLPLARALCVCLCDICSCRSRVTNLRVPSIRCYHKKNREWTVAVGEILLEV